jgi:transcriptional regulator with XRE-family HTH domain
MKGFYTWVGNQLRTHRMNRDLSLEDVAVRIGVTKKTVANYETGATKIPLDTVKQLCAIYGMDFDEFIREANKHI